MRPELMSFSQAMEKRLAEFDADKGEDGWKSAFDTEPMFERLGVKFADLRRDVADYEKAQARKVPRQNVGEARAEVLSSASDVANYAMMIADVCGALPLAEPNPSDILNLRMRGVLQNARAQIAATGSPTDEVHQVVLQEIDDVLQRKSMAMKNVIRVALQLMDEDERIALFDEFDKEEEEAEEEEDDDVENVDD